MILITGARGLIGNGLVSRLEKKGIPTISVVRSNEFSTVDNTWSVDLCNPDHIKKMEGVPQTPDVVVHLAGHIEIALKKRIDNPKSDPVPNKENLYEIYANNVINTANILQYCLEKHIKHIIFASSQTVYGIPDSQVVTEDTPLKPLEHYAMSKVMCEKILKFAENESISVSILRFPGVYSEVRKSGAVYAFCRNAIFNKKIDVVSEIPLPFDILSREDVLDAIECAIAARPQGCEAFNVASGEPCSLNILADTVASLVPGCLVTHANTPQPIIQLDSTKAYRILGWKAKPVTERLKSMLDSIHHD
jgi:nucleoside-diphosphate-sugar epimerase